MRDHLDKSSDAAYRTYRKTRPIGSHNFYIWKQKSCKLAYLTGITLDWFSLNLWASCQYASDGKTHTHNHNHMHHRCGWESKQRRAVLHRQQVATPPHKRSAIYNDIPRVIYVHITKLNFMKRMSNKAIHFIWGLHLAAISACSHFTPGKLCTMQAPGFTLGVSGPWTLTFHTYFPKASPEMPGRSFSAHCLYTIAPALWCERKILHSTTLPWPGLREAKTTPPLWPPARSG